MKISRVERIIRRTAKTSVMVCRFDFTRKTPKAITKK